MGIQTLSLENTEQQVKMGIAIKKPEGVPGRSWPAIVIGLFVAFGGVLFGYDTGTISGILAMDYWRNEFSTGYTNSDNQPDVSPSQTSLIVSILSAGTFFGALWAAPSADFLGRRMALIAACWVFNLGVILQTAATELPMFIAGRFFAGFGVGMVSALIPLYQSETAPKWIRGVIVGSYQFAITVGLLLAAIVDNATKDRQDTGSYRIPIAVQFAWSLVLIIGMLILPETPRFLIKQGKQEKAAKALAKIRRLPIDHAAIQDELGEIQANHEYELSLGKSSYIDCFRGKVLKRLLTGCLLQGLQQLTGINFIFYYGTQFFKNTGITNPFVISMITSAVNPSWTVCHRQVGSPPAFVLGSHRNDSQSTARRCPRYNQHGSESRDRSRLLHELGIAKGFNRIRVHLHLLLCFYLGSDRMGCNRRDLPPQSPSQGPLYDDRHELATQLGNCVQHALPRKLGRRQCQPPSQNLLHLVRMLLPLHHIRLLHDLRDERPDPRASRRAVRRGPRRAPQRALEADNDVQDYQGQYGAAGWDGGTW